MTAAPLSVTARAPGKLFWLGEYAVLFGGPAIVQAVDRYVVVTVESGDGLDNGIRIAAKGAGLSPLWVSFGESLNCHDAKPEHDLIVTILDALAAYDVIHPDLGNVNCTIDSRELFHGEHKLGLGSSAAVTHALVKALVSYADSVSPGRGSRLPPEFVFNVHRAFQHGRGSGADVGAGVMGGCFTFQRVSDHVMPVMRQMAVPEDLHIATIWAGKPASTSKALHGLARFQHDHPGRFTTALTPLLELAEEGCSALEAGQSARFAAICDEYGHNLSEFGRTVGVDIMSSAHRELRKIAKACGIAYKPSGAGNGDFGIGYSMDINALEYFERRARHAGFTPGALGSGRPCHRI